MVLYEYDHIMFFRFRNQVLVMLQKLRCGFRDQDVQFTLNGIQRDRVMGACSYINELINNRLERVHFLGRKREEET